MIQIWFYCLLPFSQYTCIRKTENLQVISVVQHNIINLLNIYESFEIWRPLIFMSLSVLSSRQMFSLKMLGEVMACLYT